MQPFGVVMQLLVLLARNLPFTLAIADDTKPVSNDHASERRFKSSLVAMSQTKPQSICHFEEMLPFLPGGIHEFTKVVLHFCYDAGDYILY